MSLFQDIKKVIAYRAAKALTRITFPGWASGEYGEYNSESWFWPFIQGTRIDYAREVGSLKNQTLVMAASRWAGTNMSTARLKVVTRDADNKEKEVKGNPTVELLSNPNPYYTGLDLLDAIAFSLICDATAYLIKVKGSYGNVVQLYYEPHTTIRPVWKADSNDFVTYYQLYRKGQWGGSSDNLLDPRDVLVIRQGIDPETRKGLNPTASLLREYYTDQQAAHFMARMMRNGLVPPVVVGLGDKERPFVDDAQGNKRKTFAADLTSKMTGDRAGEPMVVSGAVNVEKLGFDYSSIGLRDIRQIPEERFCSVMGISPHSLNLGASTGASTFSNVDVFLRRDYRNYIVPQHKRIAEAIRQDSDLAPPENQYLVWDYKDVPEMQGDINAEWKRLDDGYLAGNLMRSEVREAKGQKFDPVNDTVYLLPRGATIITPDGKVVTESEPVPIATGPQGQPLPMKSRRPSKDEIDVAVEWWQTTQDPAGGALIEARAN